MILKTTQSKIRVFAFFCFVEIFSSARAGNDNDWWVNIIDKNPAGDGANVNCKDVIKTGDIVGLQYKQYTPEVRSRTIAIRTTSNNPDKGLFIGTDNYGWEYGGEYFGNHFNFAMKSGKDTVSGQGVCTKYGAAGVFKYINRNVNPYHFLWVQKK